jgi:hypothetical protein
MGDDNEAGQLIRGPIPVTGSRVLHRSGAIPPTADGGEGIYLRFTDGTKITGDCRRGHGLDAADVAIANVVG